MSLSCFPAAEADEDDALSPLGGVLSWCLLEDEGPVGLLDLALFLWPSPPAAPPLSLFFLFLAASPIPDLLLPFLDKEEDPLAVAVEDLPGCFFFEEVEEDLSLAPERRPRRSEEKAPPALLPVIARKNREFRMGN